MIKEEATPIIVDLAKSFVSLMQGLASDWSTAYLRICSREAMSEAKASYVHRSGVQIIDVLEHKEFFHAAAAKGRDLLAALEKSAGLFVLIVDSALDYEIKCEYDDMNKWRISKIKGGTGVPEGLER